MDNVDLAKKITMQERGELARFHEVGVDLGERLVQAAIDGDRTTATMIEVLQEKLGERYSKRLGEIYQAASAR